MKSDAPLQTLADAYRQLLDFIENSSDDLTAAEGYVPQQAPFAELEIQSLWATGIFSNEGETVRHGHLRILDFGEWNRGPGPDFQYAEVEIDGKIMRGDIEIDPRAQDWENHGHGANPNFNNVVLHVVLSAPPRGWFTRNSLHMEVPVYYLDSESIRASLGIERTRAVTHLKTPLCRTPLSEMEPARIEQMLKSAAAFRLSLKRKRFKRQIVAFGEKQAWYEAWADTLGFSANREPMLITARRAPLRLLGKNAEAILLGVAGFLTPVLPSRSSDEAREYHRKVWDAWWKIKDSFSLSDQRAPVWNYAGIRPLNHPQRRVAALAMLASHWNELYPFFHAAGAKKLCSLLTHLHHPFWDHQSMIHTPRLNRQTSLIGRERIRNFLSNYLYVHDESSESLAAYFNLRAGAMPARASSVAKQLFGERSDLHSLLSLEYAHQALLQIASDFCSSNTCRNCLFPIQLKRWSMP